MLPEFLENKFNSFQIPFIGNSNAEIYLLVDPPNFLNVKQETPLPNQFFLPIINQLQKDQIFKDQEEFLSKVRVSSSISFLPQEKSQGFPKNRDIQDQDIRDLMDINLQDINNVSPKVIIVCGDVATKIITNFQFDSSKDAQDYNRDQIFLYHDIPVIFFNSIKSIFASSRDTYIRKEVSKFCGKFLQAKNILSGIDPTDVFKNLDWEHIDGFDPQEVKRIFDLFAGHSKITLDYETSGLNTYRKNFHLGGIGLSTLDEKTSVYIHFYDFFRRYREDLNPPEESWDLLNQFFNIKDFVVFNRQFECAVTASPALGINVNLKNCEDLLMWLRCLSEGSSLKDACVSKLGVEKWNDEVEEWIKCINEIIKLEKPTEKMVGQREEIKWLINEDHRGIFDLEEFFIQKFDDEVFKEIKKISKGAPKILKDIGGSRETYIPIIEFSKENKLRLNSKSEKPLLIEEFKSLDLPETFKYSKGKKYFLKKKDQNFLEQIKKLRKICKKHFPEKEKFQEVSMMLKEYIYGLLKNHKSFTYASYADVPLSIMAPYCIADCKFTSRLYHKLKSELEERGLSKSAETYNRQGYLGYVLTRNGIAWDDDLANELEKDYSKKALDSLKSLILLPSMIKTLGLNDVEILNIQATTDKDYLKSIFNPNSSYRYSGEDYHKTTNVRMSKVIGTPRFKLASLIYDAYEFSKQVDKDEEFKKEYPTFYPIYQTIISKKTTEERLDYLEYLLKNAKELLGENLKENQREYQKRYNGKSPKEVYERLQYKGWMLTSLDQENSKRLYLIFNEIIGIDPNDDQAWPEEFLALYYFKVYKKVEKSIGTYINGKVGRGFVEIVEKDNVGKEAPLRLCNYFDRPKTQDEVYLMRTEWGVCTADTKRWQASQHTVPKMTELMDLRTTRYEDGIKLHYDYSQAEVRVLARLANDKALLDAFSSGLDIHRYNAARMYNVPVEKIGKHSVERSMAKGVTFALLYGTSISEFANLFTRGNLQEAKRAIDNFFKIYPDVKKFIKKMHIEASKSGFVPTLFGDPLFVHMPTWVNTLDPYEKMKLVDNPYDHGVKVRASNEEEERKERSKFSKALRNSQNYPVQGTSSNLAGLAMEEFQREIENESLSVKLECFTHDSCDADLRIKDLLKTLEILPKASVDYLDREYGVPMKIDYAIGVSNNKMIELENMEIKDNLIHSHYEASEESVVLLKKQIEKFGGKVDYTIQDSKEELISIENLFTTTNAYAKAIGTPFKVLSGDIKISV